MVPHGMVAFRRSWAPPNKNLALHQAVAEFIQLFTRCNPERGHLRITAVAMVTGQGRVLVARHATD